MRSFGFRLLAAMAISLQWAAPSWARVGVTSVIDGQPKRRYYRWIEAGVFDRIFEAVAADRDLEWLSIDATVIRANAQAASGRRKRGDRKPRLSAARAGASAASSTR